MRQGQSKQRQSPETPKPDTQASTPGPDLQSKEAHRKLVYEGRGGMGNCCNLCKP